MRRPLLLLSAATLAVLLVGCDVTGSEETITLNNNTGLEPIEYTFEYNQDDERDGQISVSARPDESSPSLENLLREQAAASLSDIVSARVTRVRIRSVSTTTSATGVVPKVLSYIATTEVYLGGTAGAPIAREQDVRTTMGNSFIEMGLADGAEDVTSAARNGQPEATLVFDVEDPSSVGNPDRVGIEISYSIEVSSS
jgi:hypothetical protein